MRKLLTLALVAVALTSCSPGDNCPESLPVLEAEQVAGMVPMPAPAPRPPAPRPPAPRPAAPKAPSAPKPAPAAPKAPPRYNQPPPRPYVPPRYMAPQYGPTIIHHQDSLASSPVFWMLMMQNSSLHNQAQTGCTP